MVPLFYLMKAVVTSYSPYEACPFGKLENCINAQGEIPTNGFSIACPRSIHLGTSVIVDERIYLCDDRTSKKYDGRFDLFTTSQEKAKNYGKQEKTVIIFNI